MACATIGPKRKKEVAIEFNDIKKKGENLRSSHDVAIVVGGEMMANVIVGLCKATGIVVTEKVLLVVVGELRSEID